MMTLEDKVAHINRMFNIYYPDPKVPLNYEDPYTMLIAVLLSAQCTDARVNQVTPELFALAKTPEDMQHVPVSKIFEVIRPCGLAPTKSMAISNLSRILVEKHNGQVPNTFEELEALPGVGHKTASVVMAHAFGVPTFPVDTHIHRVATRWGLTSGKSVEQTERDLKKLFAEESWNKLHLQFILYARMYCPARGHDMSNCMICSRFARMERSYD